MQTGSCGGCRLNCWLRGVRRNEEDSLSGNSEVPEPPPAEGKTRAIPLLIVYPACSIVLVAVLYLCFSPLIPSHTAIHVGPDGVGYGSTLLMIFVACVIAEAVFAIGGAIATEFFKDGHSFQSQKSIAVGIMALGYGVIGFALATILSTVGVKPDEVSGDSVAMGLLGFLLLFTAAACNYVAVFPKDKLETSS